MLLPEQPHEAQHALKRSGVRHNAPVQVQEKVKAGLVPMNKYIITKQLTKRPEDYPDAKNQAHVQVALRRRAAGKRDGVMQVPSPVTITE